VVEGLEVGECYFAGFVNLERCEFYRAMLKIGQPLCEIYETSNQR
jgi:hypothetical protein